MDREFARAGYGSRAEGIRWIIRLRVPVSPAAKPVVKPTN
jgi:hypothetical protein